MGNMASRHHSVGDYDHMRPHSGSSIQSFYTNQRHQGPRQSEADQMQQAKRRMAAQRERELRNYHQEQQYNRSKTASEHLVLSHESIDMLNLSRCLCPG